METSASKRFDRLYAEHSTWLGRYLCQGFQVRLTVGVSAAFPGFRRPVDLQTALVDVLETYLKRTPALPEGESAASACRAALMDCAHEVVRSRLVRALTARSLFQWPLASEAQ